MHRERGQQFEASALPESEALVVVLSGVLLHFRHRLRPAQDSGNGDNLVADSDSEFSARKHERRTAIPSPENARANFGAT